jgi:hypothetical protein
MSKEKRKWEKERKRERERERDGVRIKQIGKLFPDKLILYQVTRYRLFGQRIKIYFFFPFFSFFILFSFFLLFLISLSLYFFLFLYSIFKLVSSILFVKLFLIDRFIASLPTAYCFIYLHLSLSISQSAKRSTPQMRAAFLLHSFQFFHMCAYKPFLFIFIMICAE